MAEQNLVDRLIEPGAESAPAEEGVSLDNPRPGSDAMIDRILQGRREEYASAGPGPKTFGGNVVDRIELGAPNMAIARASLAPDTALQIRRYAEHFDQPVTDFGVIDGEIVRWVEDQGVFAKVVPTMGGQYTIGDKILAFISQWAGISGPTVPQLAAGVTGTITAPSGPVSIPVAGGTAFLTDWARQALDKALADEPMVPWGDETDYDYMNMIGHGVLAAFSQGAGVGLNKLMTANPMKVAPYDRQLAMDRLEQMKWQALDNEAKRRGINLTMGQKTGLRSLMARERQMLRWDETADMVTATRDHQRLVEVPAAYADELARIGPVAGREQAISGFREGAEAVVDKAVRAKSEAARNAYGAAFREHPSLDSPFLRSLWNRDIIKQATEEARKVANARGELMGPLDAELGRYAREAAAAGKIQYPKGGVASGLSLNTWDRIKRALWDMRKPHVDPRTGEIDAMGAAIDEARRALTRELDSLTGGESGLYAKARLGYGASADLVDMVLDGGIGVIQKMKGPDRVAMVTKIFGGKAMLPEEIARTRDLFIKAGKEGEWNQGLVAHMSQVFDDAVKSAGATGNLPNQLYSRLARDKLQHDTLVAAMGEAKADSFERLLDVLAAAARSLPEGSPTATDLGAGGEAVGRGLKTVGAVLSPSTYFEAGNKVVAAINSFRTRPAARIKLAEYLLTGKGDAAIAKLKMPAPLTQRTVVSLAHILTEAGVISSDMRNWMERDRMPAVDAEERPAGP